MSEEWLIVELSCSYCSRYQIPPTNEDTMGVFCRSNPTFLTVSICCVAIINVQIRSLPIPSPHGWIVVAAAPNF
jgi:hypothetical protein